MAFNSYVFLFAFLPIVVAGYWLLVRVFASPTPAMVWLVFASVLFYGSLGPGYVLVLVSSVVTNFIIATWMGRLPAESRGRKLVLAGGIAANLLLLGLYKYTGFLADNINTLFGTHLSSGIAAYPVGLSFYTFIQIGFLLDAYVGQVKRLSFVRHTLFGTFFPYVTAGPIVRQDEVFSQLDTPLRKRLGGLWIVVGAVMFVMGLFKKVVLADSVAPYVTTLFSAAALHDPISMADAWLGSLGYTLQLYFDFSGYTDMAIGLAFMFGLRLPANFNSPLKATSLVDFWRRWHMTMTRWFTSYIYTPLTMQMMRRGARRAYSEPARLLLVLAVPVIVTFLLVGLWHGAGWGFVVWGAIQGIALAINLVWRELQTKFGLPRVPSPIGWALMMLTLVVSLVFFRAPNVATAVDVIQAMAGIGSDSAPGLAEFYGTAQLFNAVTVIPAVVWVTVLAAMALLSPRNTQQIVEEYDVALPTLPSTEREPRIRLVWRPVARWGIAIGLLAGLALVFAGGPSPFLYYNF